MQRQITVLTQPEPHHLEFLKLLETKLIPHEIDYRLDFFPAMLLKLAGANTVINLAKTGFFAAAEGTLTGLVMPMLESDRQLMVTNLNALYPGIIKAHAQKTSTDGDILSLFILDSQILAQTFIPSIDIFLENNPQFLLYHQQKSISFKISAILNKYGITTDTDAFEETLCKVVAAGLDEDAAKEIVTTASLFNPNAQDNMKTDVATTVLPQHAHHIKNYFDALVPNSAVVKDGQEFNQYKRALLTIVIIQNSALLHPVFLQHFEGILKACSQEVLDTYRLQSDRIDSTLASCVMELVTLQAQINGLWTRRQFVNTATPSTQPNYLVNAMESLGQLITALPSIFSTPAVSAEQQFSTALNQLIVTISVPNFKFDLEDKQDNADAPTISESVLNQIESCKEKIAALQIEVNPRNASTNSRLFAPDSLDALLIRLQGTLDKISDIAGRGYVNEKPPVCQVHGVRH